MTLPKLTEIKRMCGKTEIVSWYEYENGDRFRQITRAFALDGTEWPAGSYLMWRKGAAYAVAMSQEELLADRDRRIPQRQTA